MNGKLKILFKGAVDILPLLIPVFPFGVIFGAIGIELGFTVLETFATSFIIFGGASQIVFLQLLSGGASNIITVSSTFVVNSRHFLYGASLSEYLNKLSLGWKIILSYLLTDQAFAVSNPYLKKNKYNNIKHYYLLGSGFTLWTIWQISTLAGVLLGSFVPDKLGLSFTIPLTFLSLLINYFKKIDHLIVIIISGLVSLLLFNAPLKSYIILSCLSALSISFFIIKFKERKIK